MKKAMKLVHAALLLGLHSLLPAQEATKALVGSSPSAPEDGGATPQPLNPEAFAGLLANPPFTRSLGLSDSLILTGIAHFDSEVFATLLDTKTLESQVVSPKPNREGWQLIGIGGDPTKMHTWTAKIQMRGGEIASIRYQKAPPRPAGRQSGASGFGGGPGGTSVTLNASEMAEARQAAVNYREGFTSDGYPRQPPREVVEKLSRMDVGQREAINRQMIGLRNRGLGMEERRRIYEEMVNRMSQGGR